MFKLKKSDMSNVERLVTTPLFDSISLDSFLRRTAVPTKILLCPTNAIDTKNGFINENCISCGLCWIMAPDMILPDSKGVGPFLKFCEKDKMFVYTWLSLIINEYSATNVKSVGFSRTKRIPLLILDKNNLYIVKVVKTVEDLEYYQAEMEDIIALSKKELNSLNVKKIFLLLRVNKKDLSYLGKFKNSCSILSIEKIYENLLVHGRQKFTDYIQCGGI